ncbi:nitroreductase family protein [Proteocatella sphenisci]|uniref:nitroreductase family protein n=1 Tax=Proteocatella sphenisci TaxID=181070 RepID=UPI0004910F99|nr:nitroreductase family protein [Proteocatella sphenisci]
MKKNFYEAIETRRTHYGISKEEIVSDEKIKEIIEHAVKHTPSAFNSQTARVVVLLDKQHEKLWDITKEALRKIVPADKFAPTEEKINSFNAGYGTVLFFEDQDIVQYLQKEFATYKDNFPIWSKESSGMHQFNVWTSLELEGYGASLQHYNELIEEEVKKEWNIPQGWEIRAQMPFGKPTSQPGEKEFKPLEDRVKVYK